MCRQKTTPTIVRSTSCRLNLGPIFRNVGVDYTGPMMIKSGSIRKPIITKAYVCVFVCFSVKTVHLELILDLTTATFIATLQRFISWRGKPAPIWSDRCTNFVRACQEMKELCAHLKKTDTRQIITDFCTEQGIQWNFIPEHPPHFGGLWDRGSC